MNRWNFYGVWYLLKCAVFGIMITGICLRLDRMYTEQVLWWSLYIHLAGLLGSVS